MPIHSVASAEDNSPTSVSARTCGASGSPSNRRAQAFTSGRIAKHITTKYKSVHGIMLATRSSRD